VRSGLQELGGQDWPSARWESTRSQKEREREKKKQEKTRENLENLEKNSKQYN
jgi:hypothetical protein